MNLIEMVKAAGVVGAGGAGFPTHVKLNTNVEYFIVNAAECEPLIETDKYLCRTFADRIIRTIPQIAEAIGASKKVIALKGAYEKEIAALKVAIREQNSDVEIFELGYFYPAGDEQTLIQQVTGRCVPERGLPSDVGCVVDNVGTVLNIADALEGKAVTEKYLSVVGEVEHPIQLRVPIGTPVLECVKAAHPTVSDFALIMGGPMMGKQLTEQADAIVQKLDDAIADGQTLSYWGFGSQLYVNSQFFNQLSSEIYENGGMSSFCVDISDVTLRQIFKVENLSYCNLHRTRPTDENSELPSYSTARAMRQLCRETGSCVRKINPPTPSGTVELMVGRTTSDGSYTVLVTTSLMHVSEAGEVMSTVLPLAAALIFAFSMSAAWLFSEWFTKPLRQLSGAARQVAQGDYAVQVETNRRDELGDLAQEFNHMAKEVQHAAQMQRDLLANVSHDLRTPLTLIKGYAETVRDITGDDKAHRDEQMNIIVDEADRLTALVSSVMELSKVTSGAEKCEKVHFDMGQLCDEVSERYDAVCAQNGWQLKLELPEEELPVYADPNMMQRALHNLLGNAMHHIGGDGIFLLRAAKVPEGVRVEIEDHGPGICAEDLPYIFDRYYRSRSDAGKQGTGLGLSITKAIFQQHGFRFGVQSTLGKGTTFWFIATDTK